MAAEKMTDRMTRMMNRPSNIRNICTSAHIHHGKTAFTDNLLAAAGLMAERLAGDLDKGMATWQHKDEQERLMTVDAANVSMVHEYHGDEYLINLIDTPGHIDFGGNVTRAMRAIDGTIVLVCASEGIMPQTETVVRQAVRERVKPVLFINKVDRLIKEMKFTPAQIQERISSIIIEFNRLLQNYVEPQFIEKWKVNTADGSVAFGSARENWALSIPFMQKKKVSFKDILTAYDMNEEDRTAWFWKNAPLSEVVLDMVIKHLPNPLEAQPYRIPKIWRGDMESAFGKGMLACDPKGKVAFCVTRIVTDQKSGREIAAGRLFSGTITEGMTLHVSRTSHPQRAQNVFMYVGIKPETFQEVPAGNCLALGGMQTNAGDTVTEDVEEPFEELKHIFAPVITKAIKVMTPQDLPKLVEVLRKVAKEDPSMKVTINEETGENLISGMGELHLEIIENRIVTEKGLKIQTSPPVVVYRESITKPSPQAEGKSPNKHNKFYFTVEPMPENLSKLIDSGAIPEGRVKKKDPEMRKKLLDTGMNSKEADQVKDIYKGSVFLDITKGQVYLIEVIDMILDTFEDVMENGPLAREPCVKVLVKMTDMKLHEDAIHRGPAQVYPAIREGIRGAMMYAGPVLYEPMQIHLIEGPSTYIGALTALVAQKRGTLIDMKQEGVNVAIKAKLPVMEMIGWASELRSCTEGRGHSSLVDQMFEKLPNELQQKVVGQIKQRKGLTESMVGV